MRPPLSTTSSGLWWGLLGVAAFSLTLPLTKVVVAGGAMSPLFVAAGRASVAALGAALALAWTRQRLPRGRQWPRLAIVAGGVVLGFPLLTSLALTQVPASHGAVVIGLLPAATAVAAAIRGRERPPRAFWISALAGAVAAAVFATAQGGRFGGLGWPDLLLFGAVVAAAFGYAEGGLLSRELGAWQTISWALVLAAPLMLALTAVSVVRHPPAGSAAQWGAFAYLALVIMFLGFFAWYRGLAIGPIAQVGQVQLIQPVMSLCWAAALLGERLTWSTLAGGAAVIGCAAIAVRAKQPRAEDSAFRSAAPTAPQTLVSGP